MEILIYLAAAAFIWIAFSGVYKTKFQDTRTLLPDEIENSIVELKGNILRTNAYVNEREFQRLDERLREFMEQILIRHQHYVRDFETRNTIPFGFFNSIGGNEFTAAQEPVYAIEDGISFSHHSPELLIYSCFFLWHGGRAKGLGRIKANPKVLMKIIDYLIDEMQYGPAFL